MTAAEESCSPGVRELAKRFSHSSLPKSPVEFEMDRKKQQQQVENNPAIALQPPPSAIPTLQDEVLKQLREASQKEREMAAKNKSFQSSFKGLGTLSKFEETVKIKKEYEEADKQKRAEALNASASHKGPGWNDYSRLKPQRTFSAGGSIKKDMAPEPDEERLEENAAEKSKDDDAVTVVAQPSKKTVKSDEKRDFFVLLTKSLVSYQRPLILAALFSLLLRRYISRLLKR